MVRWAATALAGFLKSRTSLVAENLCLRQQLLVLRRRNLRPRLKDADRRFWIIACRWFSDWRRTLVIVQPETVLGWHRKGWKSYWRWWSRAPGSRGRHPIRGELRLLIRRMASENVLWGQRRIQAELARLGYKVSARTVWAHASAQGRPSRVGGSFKQHRRNLGLRLHQRADDPSDALCLLRGTPCSRQVLHPGNRTSNGHGAQNRRMLRGYKPPRFP